MNQYNNKVVLSNGEVLIDLSQDTVEQAKVLSGFTFHGKDGAPYSGTCTFDSDTSQDTAAVSEILLGKTAHARGTKLTGTMPNNGAVNGKISTKDGAYIIPQGFHDGSGSVEIDSTEKAKLIPKNIREGVTLLGVEGSMSGSESEKKQAKTATPSFEEQVILPDSDFTCLSQVTIAAIPVSYSDNAAGGKTVTIG